MAKAKDKPKTLGLRRVVRMSQLTADRLEVLAERMGMTSQQTLSMLVAQGAASATRATELLTVKQDDFLTAFIEGEIQAAKDET